MHCTVVVVVVVVGEELGLATVAGIVQGVGQLGAADWPLVLRAAVAGNQALVVWQVPSLEAVAAWR